MGSFGENLRKEREARGISLQEISDHTKISVRLLKAIEEEKLDQLPGGIFNKSFARQYSRYLGLDEEQMTAEYLSAVGAGRQATPSPGTAPPQDKTQPLPPGYPRVILTAVVLGVAVAGIAYGVHRFAAGKIASVSPSTVASATPGTFSADLAAEAKGVGSNAPDAGSLTDAASTPAASAPFDSPPQTQSEKAPALVAAIAEKRQGWVNSPEVVTGALLLQIDTLSAVWLSITADGEKQWQGTMQPQQTRRVQAEKVVQLTVGNAGGVVLTLNGKALPPVGGPGEVKRLTISAHGLSEPAP